MMGQERKDTETMEHKIKERMIVIHCGELYQMLLSRFWLIALAAVIGAGAGLAYSQISRPVPMYRATTKMYVTGMETAVPTSAGFSLGKQVISNYMEIIRSRPVLEQVIEELGLNMGYRQLLNCISFRTPDNTAMLELTIAFPDPQWAKTVVDKLAEVSADKAELVMGSSHPRIYEESYLPSSPYNISSMRPVKFALFGGVVVGGMAVFLFLLAYFAKNRFLSPAQVEEVLGTPVLTMLPGRDESNEEASRYREEAYRIFCSRLQYFGGGKRVYSFIHSSEGRESRSQLMLNLADYLCTIGKRVICIDGNIFCPEWGFSADMTEGGKGLREYLSGEVKLDQIVWNRKEQGPADCIGSGEKAVNSLELFGKPAFVDLLEELKESYDYVFIDSPPGEHVPDGAVISAAADGGIWLISASHTPVRTARRLKITLEGCGNLSIIGAVLDGVDYRKNRGYLLKTYGHFFGVYEKRKKERQKK